MKGSRSLTKRWVLVPALACAAMVLLAAGMASASTSTWTVRPTPSNDGTCDVVIEYELENEKLTLHDVVISIPLP